MDDMSIQKIPVLDNEIKKVDLIPKWSKYQLYWDEEGNILGHDPYSFLGYRFYIFNEDLEYTTYKIIYLEDQKKLIPINHFERFKILLNAILSKQS